VVGTPPECFATNTAIRWIAVSDDPEDQITGCQETGWPLLGVFTSAGRILRYSIATQNTKHFEETRWFVLTA
jgi:hypothetical protein